MTHFAVVLALGAVLASSGMSPAQNASPYIGQEGRSIKALSETEIRDLMEGRGMGLAKAAELNSYPGPLHVLELASQLDLSDAQRSATEALMATMRSKAQPLGPNSLRQNGLLTRRLRKAGSSRTSLAFRLRR